MSIVASLGVFGVRLETRGALPDSNVLRDLVQQEQLVVIRGLDPSVQTLVDAAVLLGEVRSTPFFESLPDHPGITPVRHDPADGRRVLGGSWHADLSFLDEPPRHGLVLSVEAPPRGGATLFASRRLALSQLSPTSIRYFESLSCVLSGAHVFGTDGAYADDSTRPIAALQPTAPDMCIETTRSLVATFDGERSLSFDPGYCVGISPLTTSESSVVWRWLDSAVTDWDVVTPVLLEPGDLVIWDNRTLLHKAATNQSGPRTILRTNTW